MRHRKSECPPCVCVCKSCGPSRGYLGGTARLPLVIIICAASVAFLEFSSRGCVRVLPHIFVIFFMFENRVIYIYTARHYKCVTV